MSDDDYLPIDCSLHDRLEDIATRRRSVAILHEDDAGVVHEIRDAIVDWFAQDGVEYARTGRGTVIRLDRIVEVDGVSYR